MSIVDPYPSPPLVIAPHPPSAPARSLALSAERGTEVPGDGQGGSNLHWQNGITYLPYSQQPAQLRSPYDLTSQEQYPAQPSTIVSFPFLVVATDVCSSFGWAAHNYKERASEVLNVAFPQALGYEFWTGTQATAAQPHPYLTNAATVTDITPGGTLPSVVRALQLLEDALANTGYGGQGMLHVQPQTAPNRQVAYPDPDWPGRLITYAGNIVVIDPGYIGTGPNGVVAPPGSTWLYASDMVQVWEDDPPAIFPDTFAEAMDRRTNTIAFTAQKLAMVAFDQLRHFAIRCQTLA